MGANIVYIRCKMKIKAPFKNIAIVGDQLFTDILGGKLTGIRTFLVHPILLEDKTSFKIRRKLENVYLKKYRKGEM